MPAEGDNIVGRIDAQWQAVLACRRGGTFPESAGELAALYAPLCAVRPGCSFIVGHLAQSLDGRIATAGGASRWISGDEDLRHTHRMRALADAVIVGADTVRHDDPLLTVRRCSGMHPVRVIIDPDNKLALHHRVFRDTTTTTLVIVAADSAPRATDPGIEMLTLPREDGIIAPRLIREVLAERGLHWLFIEGGGVTISHFLHAGCLDRLQIAVAPVILGSGRPSLSLPEIMAPDLGLRPQIRHMALGQDVLFECIFGN